MRITERSVSGGQTLSENLSSPFFSSPLSLFYFLRPRLFFFLSFSRLRGSSLAITQPFETGQANIFALTVIALLYGFRG